MENFQRTLDELDVLTNKLTVPHPTGRASSMESGHTTFQAWKKALIFVCRIETERVKKIKTQPAGYTTNDEEVVCLVRLYWSHFITIFLLQQILI